MQTFSRLAVAGLALTLSIATAGAQTPPPAATSPATAPAATAPPPVTAPVAAPTAATTPTKPKKERTAESLKCSADADAKGLHGAERKSFRKSCMKEAKAAAAAAAAPAPPADKKN